MEDQNGLDQKEVNNHGEDQSLSSGQRTLQQTDDQTYQDSQRSQHSQNQPVRHDQGYQTEGYHTQRRSNSVGKPSEITIRKAKEFVIFTYMSIAALLGFRFILSLFGASQESTFVSFIYDITYPPLLPFDGMFGRDLYRPSGYVIEFEVLVALLVYAVVFYGFNRLIDILFD